MLLPTFPLPLPSAHPPNGYDWADRATSSISSSSTAFDSGLDRRERFLGERRCIICGIRYALHRCHIIGQAEEGYWTNLQNRNWIPSPKESPTHEARNGLTLCSNHHTAFDQFYFFIRYLPEIRMFVFVNYSNQPDLQQFHGAVTALDSDDVHAPFPSLFIIHEMRVRGFHPFQPLQPDIPDEPYFVEWIYEDDLWDEDEGCFKRNKPPRTSPPRKKQKQTHIQGSTAGASSSRKLELNASVIADILTATRAMPSWKACQLENTSWEGTAEENIDKYVSSIGVEDL